MVWKTIKAVYGYKLDITKYLDEEGDINVEKLKNSYCNINSLDCTPSSISELDTAPVDDDDLIKIFPPCWNGDGIAVGTRSLEAGKLVNSWKHYETIKNNSEFCYDIPEFDHYTDKNGYHHYSLLHNFSCCSNSRNKYVVIGVTYDEVDRNLFLDTQFDDICHKVFNERVCTRV